MKEIKVIGAGLAGCEAALQLVKYGYQVKLYEMRPHTPTPVHTDDDFAELVCSNSLKSLLPTTASGMLKKELEVMDCELLKLAKEASVPAGNALAVDRKKFSQAVRDKIEANENIEIINEEVNSFENTPTIIATGPVSSDAITRAIIELLGNQQLYFFDAIAPIVSKESLDLEIVFRKSRYDKGEADYYNCPFSRDEYYEFVDALIGGKKYEAKEFEDDFFSAINFNFYENCTPIEELARRGKDTLRYGVMRPVGLEDPRTDRRAYAVIQLRAENKDFSSFNLVGCQTMLRQAAQKAILRKIPGLAKAEFLRYGSIHRNTYLNAPQVLNTNLSLKAYPHLKIAGQLAGVEGYTESIMCGLWATFSYINTAGLPPVTSVSGAILRHLFTPNDNFQPMNSNFGILPTIEMEKKNKKLKKELLYARGIADFKTWANLAMQKD